MLMKIIFLCVTNYLTFINPNVVVVVVGARCSSEVRAFAEGAMGCRIDPLW